MQLRSRRCHLSGSRPDRLAASLDTARHDVQHSLAMLDRFVATQPLLHWHCPKAGLIGLTRMAHGDAESCATRLLQAPYRTFLLPGTTYGLRQHLHLGVGGGPEVLLDDGLVRLVACLAAGNWA